MSAKTAQNQLGQRMYPKGAQTRQRLLKATADLMEKRSVRDLKVTEITALAGAATSTFYIYFDDVSSAVLAVTEQVEQFTPEIKNLLDQPWTAQNAYQNARALVQAYVSFWDQHHAVLRVRNLAAEEGDKRFREARHRSTEPLLVVIQQKVQASGLPVDAGAVATIIMSILERIPAITRVPSPRRRSRPRMIDAAAFTIAALITPHSISLDVTGVASEPAADAPPGPIEAGGAAPRPPVRRRKIA